MNKVQYPKFYRQRYLLFLLEQAGGGLSKMDFQKLLFLSHQEAKFCYYDFVPYHYGCYSFQAASDLELLESQGWIQSSKKNITLKNTLPLEAGIKRDERHALVQWMRDYKGLRGESLVKHVYYNYPYYAIYSKMADRLVDTRTYGRIQEEKKRTQNSRSGLFTIGYEGSTFEAYLNKLIQNNVRLLCDVRKNPLSRKFGFSKGILSSVLPKLGICYRHVPQLGIISQKRKFLNNEIDYVRLLEDYREHLPEKDTYLQGVKAMLKRHKRIALTCFEKNPLSCHRHCVSDYLGNEWNIRVLHL